VPIVSLSDLTLRALKPIEGKQIMYWDKGLKSFGIRVSPKGTMTWTLLVGQERQRIKLGNYPVIGLKDARELARRQLAERTLGQHKRRAVSFSEALANFDATHLINKRPKTSYELRRLLKNHFVPKLGRRQLSDLEAHHFTDITDTLTPGTAWHAFAAAQTFLNWTVARRYIKTSPLAGVPSPPKSTPRARVLTDAELQSIWRACEAGESPVQHEFEKPRLPRHYATIVKLLILTGQRKGEIAALQTSWISSDNSIALPAAITKNGRSHSFPIGATTASLLASLTSTANISSGSTAPQLLFPARGKNSTPFNGWSKSKAALDKLSGTSGWTLHDLRRTFASNMAALGVAPHVVEKLLNHASGQISGVAAIYNRYNLMPEMRDAIGKYEDYLKERVIPAA
jgi:integrase